MRGATRSTGAGQVAGFSSTSPITPPVRPKSANIGKRAAKPFKDDSTGRVRVAVRLRPQNVEELAADEDSADCVELQPELKRLKLRKNNWNSETFQFDEVFTETASQKRVYEVVAKPVVELYLDTVQDLLAPEKANIPIVEDPKWGDISLPGATIVQVHDCKSFMQLLQTGEANRFAANTKMNTESSRSHAILLIYINKSVKEEEGNEFPLPIENDSSSQLSKMHSATSIRKSKLLIVDLAGSERIDKSGSEGHTLEEAKCINLSLTALGKCINALAENSSHIPARDSKLTRLLRDSFGGTARTSLVVTISPSPQHRGETTSTIMFGQRAMKVENMVKLKEEFDYKSLCHKLESQVDFLTIHNERQTKLALDTKQDMEKKFHEFQRSLVEAEKKFSTSFEKELQAEKQMHRIEIGSISELHQQEISEIREKLEKELQAEQQMHRIELGSISELHQQEILEIREKLEAVCHENELLNKELFAAKRTLSEKNEKIDARYDGEIQNMRQTLKEDQKHREILEDEVHMLKEQSLQLNCDLNENRKSVEDSGKLSIGSKIPITLLKSSQSRDTTSAQRATIAKLFEGVGLPKILSYFRSEDVDVQIHAAKVVANLAARESNQEKIVEAGGLGSLLMLLGTSEDETIQRVAAGAIANLAMNERNQELIMNQGGIKLLAKIANEAEDPQTLRMVGGAVANLCGNNKLQMRLKDEGGIKSLLGMVRSSHLDVLAQVARGFANLAKCESRGVTQGHQKGRSLLIDDGALDWIVANSNNQANPIRRHIEVALCHLSQHEANARDIVACGALRELVRISRECSREDIRNLAKRTLYSNPTFQVELRRMHLPHK